MAEGLNQVTLIGNLGQDPELRQTQAGATVMNLRMATTENYLDRDKVRKERTEWHSIVVWGPRAEGLAKILAKGSRVAVVGSLQTRSWEAKDGGGKRYTTEVNARQVVLCGGRGGDMPGGEDQGGAGGEAFGSDDIPF